MNQDTIRKTQEAIRRFVEGFREEFGRTERRESCLHYISGLMIDGNRKSIEPMATRIPEARMQNMQQFIQGSPWDYRKVLCKLQEKMEEEIGDRNGILVLDDTSFPKQGRHSVGVGRQYCGALGKIANCQVIVSWHYASKDRHWPIDAKVFLPEEWASDSERMKKAKVPDEQQTFKKKWEQAITLLKGIKDRVSHKAVVFDGGYGELMPFLAELDTLKEHFVGRIPETHSYWDRKVRVTKRTMKTGRPRNYEEVYPKSQRPLKARDWGNKIEEHMWKKIVLKQKSGTVEVKAHALRVREAISKAYWRPGKERWLIIEEIKGERRYYVSNYGRNQSLQEMLEIVHMRWRVEQGYAELKEELGFDHYEGRSWQGLHHHIAVSFMAYCFLELLRRNKVKKTTSKLPSRKLENGSTRCFQSMSVQNADVGLRENMRYFSCAA